MSSIKAKKSTNSTSTDSSTSTSGTNNLDYSDYESDYDDEIDYDLWNPSHPLGSSYYGIIIENMPLVEALPDESHVMKYKLVTLPRGTAKMPILNVGYSSITIKHNLKSDQFNVQMSVYSDKDKKQLIMLIRLKY